MSSRKAYHKLYFAFLSQIIFAAWVDLIHATRLMGELDGGLVFKMGP